MKCFAVCSMGFVLVILSHALPAQNYPAKPVRLVVAFAPGGATDTFSRVTAAEMSKTMEAMKTPADAMQRTLEQDVGTWAEVVKATGVKLQ